MVATARFSPSVVLAFAGLVACGGSTGGSDRDAAVADRVAPAPDGPFVEAKHLPFPQIVYQGSALVLAPELVTVTFQGDPLADELEAFGKAVEGSHWFSQVVSGYCEGKGGPCIGPGAPASSVRYPMGPEKRYTDSANGGPSTLKTWLAGAITSGALPKPTAPTPSAKGNLSNTLYLLYFPASTQVILDGSGGCASGTEGYHDALVYEGTQVAYAIIQECAGAGMEVPPVTTLQGTTITASHEIVEAATDPSDFSTGYYLDLNDAAIQGWNDIEGGEVADMCVDQFLLAQDEWKEGGFTYQRIWSNAQAAAGLDPCTPITTGKSYFNAAPTRSFFTLDVGTSITFEVDAFSVGPRADWKVVVQDWNFEKHPFLEFSLAGGTFDSHRYVDGDVVEVNNGSKVSVTMKLLRDPATAYNGEADGAVVSFTGEMTTAPASFWAFSVLTPAEAKRDHLRAGAPRRRRGNEWAPWRR